MPKHTSELEELALRCEQATGPDYALDQDILRACGWRYEEYDRQNPRREYPWL